MGFTIVLVIIGLILVSAFVSAIKDSINKRNQLLTNLRTVVSQKEKAVVAAESQIHRLEKTNKELSMKISWNEKEYEKEKRSLNELIEKQKSIITDITVNSSVDLEKYFEMIALTMPPTKIDFSWTDHRMMMLNLLSDAVKQSVNEVLNGNSKLFPPLVADLGTVNEGIEVYKMWLSKSVVKQERAVKITELKAEKKKLIQENVILHQQLNELFSIFPHAEEIITYDGISDKPEIEEDPVSSYMTKEEYNSLSNSQKNQLALDRYKQAVQKTNWEIGRDFEMYVGYTAEKRGFSVEYFGTQMKLKDLGRDLIFRKGDNTVIVQCKYWGKDKVIHEKHIAQLYGTTAMYKLENPQEAKNVFSLFICHNSLSDEAKRFADFLGVKYIEELELGDYPMIKCNISNTGERIYHLPFDQKYDDTIIGNRKGEFMAFTVEEAELRGFRRAWKYHGEF